MSRHAVKTERVEIIDPEGCGCTDCLTGEARNAKTGLERRLTENGERLHLKVTELREYSWR